MPAPPHPPAFWRRCHPANIGPGSVGVHTATLVDGAIYVIGSLGYDGTRRYVQTPVHRLHVGTFRIERLDASGEAPGGIYDHRAVRVGPSEIRVSGGKVVTSNRAEEAHTDIANAFVLDVDRRLWRRER